MSLSYELLDLPDGPPTVVGALDIMARVDAAWKNSLGLYIALIAVFGAMSLSSGPAARVFLAAFAAVLFFASRSATNYLRYRRAEKALALEVPEITKFLSYKVFFGRYPDFFCEKFPLLTGTK